MSQPFNWDFMFDPPDLREHTDYGCSSCSEPDEDGRVELGCSNCHDFDIDMAISEECDLCVGLLEGWIAAGEWCAAKPKEHGGNYMDGETINGRFVYKKPATCLECVAEKGGVHANDA
ncbi:MAG TPA: hypothetical protein VD994_17980 [Prosthecobacter sp.]|nr:hypothetical protein [Prosthecobacter sp.]